MLYCVRVCCQCAARVGAEMYTLVTVAVFGRSHISLEPHFSRIRIQKSKMSETLSDRASTRVHAPPGGASSMASILGGGAPEAPVARPAPSAPQFVPTTNNAVAAGSARPIRSEYTMSDAPSTRVHAAPGGRSEMASLIFGGGEPVEPAAPKPAPAQAPINMPPAAGQMAAGQRVANRTEYMGISEVSSSRVLAAPGGQSSMAAILSGAGESADDRKAALLQRRAQVGAPFADATNSRPF